MSWLRSHFPKQLTLEKAFQHLNLNDCEKEVVEVLLAHYNRTGSPFKYINYAEDIQLDYSSQILQEAIRKLRQDRAMNALKLGLKKAFLEKLRYYNPIIILEAKPALTVPDNAHIEWPQ